MRQLSAKFLILVLALILMEILKISFCADTYWPVVRLNVQSFSFGTFRWLIWSKMCSVFGPKISNVEPRINHQGWILISFGNYLICMVVPGMKSNSFTDFLPCFSEFLNKLVYNVRLTLQNFILKSLHLCKISRGDLTQAPVWREGKRCKKGSILELVMDHLYETEILMKRSS